MRQKSFPSIKTDLHCFGPGIQTSNFRNQLHQTMLFCFELTTKTLPLHIDVLIVDPDETSVPTDIKYINTYNQGHTKLYSCSYTPRTRAGLYRISFVDNHLPIANQQYSVFIHSLNDSTRQSSRGNRMKISSFSICFDLLEI